MCLMYSSSTGCVFGTPINRLCVSYIVVNSKNTLVAMKLFLVTHIGAMSASGTGLPSVPWPDWKFDPFDIVLPKEYHHFLKSFNKMNVTQIVSCVLSNNFSVYTAHSRC